MADSGNNRIQKFTSNGRFLDERDHWYAYRRIYLPRGVAVDSKGFIYVADTNNHRIQKFDPSHDFVPLRYDSNELGDGFQSPEGIIVDSKGFIYVADTGNNRIQKFDPSGNFIVKWGDSGSNKGELRFPSDLAFLFKGSDVYIYVADSENNRIEKYIQVEIKK